MEFIRQFTLPQFCWNFLLPMPQQWLNGSVLKAGRQEEPCSILVALLDLAVLSFP